VEYDGRLLFSKLREQRFPEADEVIRALQESSPGSPSQATDM
jgi:hypothetical protein